MDSRARARARVFGPVASCILALLIMSLAEAQQTSRHQQLGIADSIQARSDFSEQGTPIGELLERLAKEHGVPLTAQDDGVADQKILLYARRQPAGEVLDQVAETLGLEWRWDKKQGFVLARGRKALNYAREYRRRRAAREQVLARARFKRYRTMIRLAVRNAGQPPVRMREGFGRPWVDRVTADLLPLAAGLPDAQLQQLFTAGSQALRVRVQLSERSGWGMTRMVQRPAFSLPLSRLGDQAGLVRQYLLETADGTSEHLAPRYRTVAGDPDAVVHFGNFRGDSLEVYLTSERTPGWGPQMTLTEGCDSIDADPEKELNQGLTAAELKAIAEFYEGRRGKSSGVPPVSGGTVVGLHPQDAARTVALDSAELKKLLLPSRKLSFPTALLALHRSLGRTVIADYFTKPQRLELTAGNPNTGKWLEGVCERFGRDCTVTKDALQLRSVTWPDDEQYETPLRHLRPWLESVKSRGYLKAAEWLQMGRLTERQLIALCAPSDLFPQDLGLEARCALAGYNVLQLYHLLNPGQQARLGAASPLRWQDLTGPQQEYAQQLVLQTDGPRSGLQVLREHFKFIVSLPPPGESGLVVQDYGTERRTSRFICGVTLRLPGASGASASYEKIANRLQD